MAHQGRQSGKPWHGSKKAAAQNDENAIVLLAQCLTQGRGADKDIAQAIKLYSQIPNHHEAQTGLGRIHYYGMGDTPINYTKAFQYFCKAQEIEPTHREAQYMLALCHYYGHGTPVNYAKSDNLFNATSYAHNIAERYIADIHFDGHVADPDFMKHYSFWKQDDPKNWDGTYNQAYEFFGQMEDKLNIDSTLICRNDDNTATFNLNHDAIANLSQNLTRVCIWAIYDISMNLCLPAISLSVLFPKKEAQLSKDELLPTILVFDDKSVWQIEAVYMASKYEGNTHGAHLTFPRYDKVKTYGNYISTTATSDDIQQKFLLKLRTHDIRYIKVKNHESMEIPPHIHTAKRYRLLNEVYEKWIKEQ